MRRPDEFVLGVDVGQARDPSAFAMIRRVPRATGKVRDDYEPGTLNQRRLYEYEDSFHLGLLERMPLHTPYAAVAARVTEILQRCGSTCSAVVDQTGVGRPVVELMMHLPIVPVTITAGQGTSNDYDGWKVAKKLLVSNAQVLLQNGRLVVSSSLRLVDDFVREMLSFKVRLSASGNQTFDTWREGVHDDLVLAVCLAAWWGTRQTTCWLPTPPGDDGRPLELPASRRTPHEQRMVDEARRKFANG